MILDDEWSTARHPQNFVQQALALIALHVVQNIAEQGAIERAVLERENLPVERAKRHADRRQDPVDHVHCDHGFSRKRHRDHFGDEPASGPDIEHPAIVRRQERREVLEQLKLISGFVKPVQGLMRSEAPDHLRVAGKPTRVVGSWDEIQGHC